MAAWLRPSRQFLQCLAQQFQLPAQLQQLFGVGPWLEQFAFGILQGAVLSDPVAAIGNALQVAMVQAEQLVQVGSQGGALELMIPKARRISLLRTIRNGFAEGASPIVEPHQTA